MFGDALEMATHLPSAVRYALRGALAWSRFPTRPGTMPSWLQASVDVSMRRASGSIRLTSTSCPPPPCTSRWYSAIITAKVADWAATPSARKKGGSVGGPSGCPVTWANPLMASASVPKPGRSLVGPPRP